ncbi:MAG TPA: hemerythrin domain-containing protein [Actinocrinis sp.]|nr:hemerythrin domain-containing protein [Actinocrinis sp.]
MTLMDDADNERVSAAAMPAGSVISVLLEQHAKIRDSFAAVQTTTGEARQAAFDRLRERLAVHESGEEVVLRPVSLEDAGEAVVDARNREESEAAHVLAGLEKMDVSDPQFLEKLAEFEQAVSDHAAHEESEEFPAVQAAHSDEELRELGAKLLKAEAMAPTHPHPTAAGSPTAQRVVGPFAALLDKARDAHRS